MITIKESTREDVKNIQSLWADGDVMEFIWPGGLKETEEGVWEWLIHLHQTIGKPLFHL